MDLLFIEKNQRFLDESSTSIFYYVNILFYSFSLGKDAKKFTVEKLDYHEELLIEEIEPTPFSDTLFCYLVLNAHDHNLTEEKSNRKERVKHLISCIRGNLAKLSMFYQALVDSKCSSAIQEACRSCERPLPGRYLFGIIINYY